MKKPLVLAVLGAVVGVVVALVLFLLVFGGGGAGEAQALVPTPEPTVVNVPGKLGPHITLQDRVFNLHSTTPVYLKMQTIIEFETTDPRWGRVLHGCVALPLPFAGPMYASADPVGAVGRRAPATESAAGSPCEAEEHALQTEFEEEIGSGRQLIEDAVTTIVTSKTAQELATAEGKDALKREIREAIQEILEEHHVSRVLFVNFITQ